ncbi:double-cubane-cluster-containing anaerobic reductase [Acidaminobacter sp.]|uniref:double-cubane-cluster-containing anaerobic reductase n=1 Tax=Acidaminobacter sp. TaxID=1872102 RepID=UPI00255E7707|nr:double-cubane-cluster-containing anaerobic reductase [Acidaminobacter sp.]MDK9712069.1 double-cubane-cluster-containing anaerobic reductase [Acidaminobacter sp.]
MSERNTLPEIFESFADARKQGFLAAKAVKDAGKNLVGYYCTFTPVEVIMAAGAVPVGLCATSDETIPESEKVLPRNLCPLVKSSYGFAVTDKCPYFYFSDLIVGETTCDGKKKMYELLDEVKPTHILQLPNEGKSQRSLDYFREEVQSFKERLEKEFNVTITNEDLKKAIQLKNRQRETLKEFYNLMSLTPPPVSGLDIHKALYGSEFKFDKEAQIVEMQALTKQIYETYKVEGSKISENAPRILITGCTIAGATEKIITAIEENGGVVVTYENCFGTKAVEEMIDETLEPIDGIARKYLNTPCSVMSNNQDRLDKLSELITRFKVDGVVDVVLQACHTYNIEGFSVKRHVKEKHNLPYIALETDYASSDTGQLKTRLGAFIEML